MKKLSIFIDESGDFGEIKERPAYYLVNRKEAVDKVSLSGRLAKAINTAMSMHQEFFAGFDNIIVYYDNGQSELGAILNAVLSIQFSNVDVISIIL